MDPEQPTGRVIDLQAARAARRGQTRPTGGEAA